MKCAVMGSHFLHLSSSHAPSCGPGAVPGQATWECRQRARARTPGPCRTQGKDHRFHTDTGSAPAGHACSGPLRVERLRVPRPRTPGATPKPSKASRGPHRTHGAPGTQAMRVPCREARIRERGFCGSLAPQPRPLCPTQARLRGLASPSCPRTGTGTLAQFAQNRKKFLLNISAATRQRRSLVSTFRRPRTSQPLPRR